MTVTSRTTIRDVAAQAGVSPMTVSRVLGNRSGRFSEETRDRVLQAVKELQYVPVAQPMTQGRQISTRVLSIYFDGTPMHGFWGLPAFWGMSEAARELNYDLLTLLRERPEWMDEQEELQFLDRRSDGMIFIAPANREGLLEALLEKGVPIVSCFTPGGPATIPSVLLDNAGAMQRATEHLLSRGHKRIMHLRLQTRRWDFDERQRGYELAMSQAGLPSHSLMVTDMLLDADKAALAEMMKQAAITGVVCASDNLAVRAWKFLESQGLSIPKDVSVTGMDDLAEPAELGLTTIRFSCEEVGNRTVRAVVKLIEGADPAECSSVVPVELIERSSVAPPQ